MAVSRKHFTSSTPFLKLVLKRGTDLPSDTTLLTSAPNQQLVAIDRLKSLPGIFFTCALCRSRRLCSECLQTLSQQLQRLFHPNDLLARPRKEIVCCQMSISGPNA